jgi:hypothetical protein
MSDNISIRKGLFTVVRRPAGQWKDRRRRFPRRQCQPHAHLPRLTTDILVSTLVVIPLLVAFKRPSGDGGGHTVVAE